MQTAPHTPQVQAVAGRAGDAIDAGRQTGGEMLWEVVDLAGGFAVMFLPLLLLAVPGLALFVLLPAVLLLAVAAVPALVAAALIGLPYLLIRAARRRRLRTRRKPRRPRHGLPIPAH